MTLTADISAATSVMTADTLHLAVNGLSTALSTLTADAASPTSAHVSSAVSAQASISTVQSTGLSTQVSASTALSSALSTLTLDAGSPTSAHVSSAVSAFVIYQAALSVPALSTRLSTIQADWNTNGGPGGVAGALLSTHLAAVSRPDGGVQINLKADLSTAFAAIA